MKYILLIFLFIFTACDDSATVVRYDKNIKDIKCLRLSIFPPDVLISSTLKELYKFDDQCKYTLKSSRKAAIVCNSNQNAPKKTLSNFPSAFIRLDIYEGKRAIYSYYKDLRSPATKEDIRDGFLHIKSKLLSQTP